MAKSLKEKEKEPSPAPPQLKESVVEETETVAVEANTTASNVGYFVENFGNLGLLKFVF